MSALFFRESAAQCGGVTKGGIQMNACNSKRVSDREIIEELSQHLEERSDELRTGGTIDADARRLASRNCSILTR